MKKITLLFMLIGIFLNAKAELNFPDPAVFIDFSTSTNDGIILLGSSNPNDENYIETAQMGGVNCRKIPAEKFMDACQSG